MHRPSVVSDELIAHASPKPTADEPTPERLSRSLPARSTRYSLPTQPTTPLKPAPVAPAPLACMPPTAAPPAPPASPSAGGRRSVSSSTACERDESAFICVKAVWRLESAAASCASASSAVAGSFQHAPATLTPAVAREHGQRHRIRFRRER
eukprot:5152506-Prymnesium_polylepis.2